MIELFKLIFASISQGLILGTKLAPSEKIKEDNHIIKRPALVEREFVSRLENSRLFLSVHPRLKVDTFVEIRFHDLQDADKEKFRIALHEMFPKR